jgi:uncharacterized surface protein with fasciclin (FAS1) repeats
MSRIRSLLAVSAASIAVLGAAGAAFAGAGAHQDAAPAVADRDIVGTAVASGRFETLVSLLKQAGLAKTLRGKGPYTVFAPTDAAFAKVPKATLSQLAKNMRKLRSVLLYHVADGSLIAAKVVKRSSIETLNGQRLRVRVRRSRVFVGGARVTTPDVRASNGVVHVINKVLIPR